jgi:hypothetical protein
MAHKQQQRKLKLSFLSCALSLMLLAARPFCANAQNFLHAEGQHIVNEKGENVLLRGMGLGGWMLQEGYMLRVNGIPQQQNVIKSKIEELIGAKTTEEFYDLWLANHTRKIDVDSMKAWGFNSIRLPMHFALYTLPVDKEPVKGKDTWLEKGFALTDSLLAWCKANQMYLILDLHATPGGQGNDLNISDRDPSKPSLWDSEENKQKMIRLWKKLAERYVNEDRIAGYDIINEPNWGFEDPANDKNGLREKKNKPLRQLMIDITKAIREIDKHHIVIIEGNGWGNNYNGILPIWDSNMVLSFHKYWNFNDINSIKQILNYREKNNLPVWLGETGENSNVWFTQAIELLEKNNIGWSWWPLKKLGSNNPLEISSNTNYQQILDYWSGKGAKPNENDARKGLFKLAEDIKLENNIYHKDVIDAMMRQPHSVETKPYHSNTITANTVLQAVDYDLGRNGYAYADKDTADYRTVIKSPRGVGNKGHVYRNDGVDIQRDGNKGFFVSDMEDDEWLQYTLNVKEKGVYAIQLTVAAARDSGLLSVSVNGVTINPTVTVPNTGANNKWQVVEIPNVALAFGKQVLRIYVNRGDYNLKELSFIKGSAQKK